MPSTTTSPQHPTPSVVDKSAPSPQCHNIDVWRPIDLDLLEAHRGVGVHRPVPRHWHEEYQLCLIEAGIGDLSYRGAAHPTPPASLFVVHPGETHSNRSFQTSGCTYRTILLDPGVLSSAATGLFGRECGAPFFRTPVLFDRDLISAFTALHVALAACVSTLERETRLQMFAADLVGRHGQPRQCLPKALRRQPGVRRACEYLMEHCVENVLLETLAGVVGLSPFHFSRVFCEQIGMPPHAFQMQARVARAKALLMQAKPIAQVAVETGFADQSHLTRCFKRLVGVTPGRYRQNSKNVQANASPLD